MLTHATGATNGQMHNPSISGRKCAPRSAWIVGIDTITGMKRTIPPAVILAVLTLMAGPLTSEERGFLLAQLEKSSRTVRTAFDDVSDAQWKFKPAPDRWSIAECAEHIATADTAMFIFGTNQLL